MRNDKGPKFLVQLLFVYVVPVCGKTPVYQVTNFSKSNFRFSNNCLRQRPISDPFWSKFVFSYNTNLDFFP